MRETRERSRRAEREKTIPGETGAATQATRLSRDAELSMRRKVYYVDIFCGYTLSQGYLWAIYAVAGWHTM